MGTVADRLTGLLAPVVEGLGYECVGVDYISGSRGSSTLRVYIDSDNGITLDDCSAVSHQLSGVLEVEDPIRENFVLEVSSPGLDRPLFTPEHYIKYQGRQVTLRFHGKWNGRRKLTGTLLAYADGEVSLDCEGEQIQVPYADISRGRLVPDL
jgi:ribosome maturation factor RimP